MIQDVVTDVKSGCYKSPIHRIIVNTKSCHGRQCIFCKCIFTKNTRNIFCTVKFPRQRVQIEVFVYYIHIETGSRRYFMLSSNGSIINQIGIQVTLMSVVLFQSVAGILIVDGAVEYNPQTGLIVLFDRFIFRVIMMLVIISEKKSVFHKEFISLGIHSYFVGIIGSSTGSFF